MKPADRRREPSQTPESWQRRPAGRGSAGRRPRERPAARPGPLPPQPLGTLPPPFSPHLPSPPGAAGRDRPAPGAAGGGARTRGPRFLSPAPGRRLSLPVPPSAGLGRRAALTERPRLLLPVRAAPAERSPPVGEGGGAGEGRRWRRAGRRARLEPSRLPSPRSLPPSLSQRRPIAAEPSRAARRAEGSAGRPSGAAM